MRLLYVFLDQTKSPGVLKKVKDKIKFLNIYGIETKGIFFNNKIENDYFNVEEKIKYIKSGFKPLPFIFNRRYLRNIKWWVSIERNNRAKYKLLYKEICKEKFDLILMRYPLGSSSLYKLTKQLKHKIIFEHNSKELVEMGLQPLCQAMEYQMKQEEKYGKLSIENSLGIIGVGNEVLEYQIGRARKQPLHCTIPNGIDVNKVPVREYINDKDGLINILFLTGSPSPWVGIDIVLKSIANCENKNKIKLYIVGPLNKELVLLSETLELKEIVFFTGELHGVELDQYFNKCLIAIGTMAMHRVGLKEHSTLKACEYAARGIPFVLGYDDTNFYKSKIFEPYVLRIKLVNDFFSFNEVFQYAKKVLDLKEHSLQMREAAINEIDFSVQMKKLAQFLLLSNGKQ